MQAVINRPNSGGEQNVVGHEEAANSEASSANDRSLSAGRTSAVRGNYPSCARNRAASRPAVLQLYLTYHLNHVWFVEIRRHLGKATGGKCNDDTQAEA
jgi:hypothetical protein